MPKTPNCANADHRYVRRPATHVVWTRDRHFFCEEHAVRAIYLAVTMGARITVESLSRILKRRPNLLK